MEPRRERLGARTLPCNCGEERRIKVFSGVWMCLGEKLDIIEQEKAINIKRVWIVTKKLHPYP